MNPLRVAIVGCGLIGNKRAKALAGAKLVACADIDVARAEALARSAHGAAVCSDIQAVIARQDVDAVIVATPNDSLTKISISAIRAGKHVLVEKPAARSVRELDELIAAAEKTDVRVRVGFNHRYHPAFVKARKMFDEGLLGEMMFVRGRYGHGGRVGYEKEWRMDPRISGGGELIDQGTHLIDLARCFLGDFSRVSGFAGTYFWNAPVDDNAFLMLRTAAEKTAFLHVSCTEWKNLFSFEIYGKNAKLAVDGLGGSYGPEKLTYYKMLPQMGVPETTVWDFPGGDASWESEFTEFIEDIRLKRRPSAGLADARAALKIVEEIEKESGYDHSP